MAESKKSNFSVTCNLLSQYLRKNRSFVEPNRGSYRPLTTLNLLPEIDVSADNGTDTSDSVSVSDRNEKKSTEAENRQLTIFYAGKVMVFDNFSPEKAADIMNLAARGSSATAGSLPMLNHAKFNTSEIPMPIARRASLQRFLEKRKDRLNSKVPYQMNGSSRIGSTPKSLEAKSWLGLGLEISN